MKKLKKGVLFLGALVLVSAFFAAPGMAGAAKEVNGKVVMVSVRSRQLMIAYKSEGDFYETVTTFRTNDQTKLVNVSELPALRINDPVLIRYNGSKEDVPMATHVEKKS